MEKKNRATLLAPLLLSCLVLIAVPASSQQPASGVCPFTGAPPTKPAVPFTRCLDANTASCCPACSDIQVGLLTTTTTLGDIINQISSTVASIVNVGATPICETFAAVPECEQQIEQLVCAVNCNPDSPTFVAKNATSGGFTFSVCQGQADAVYQACQGISVNAGLLGTISLGSVVKDSQTFLSYLFQAFAASFLPGKSIAVQVSSTGTGCYSGPVLLPTTPVCCDPLSAPSTCAPGVLNLTDPQLVINSGNTTQASTCRANGAPLAPLPPSPPAAAQAPASVSSSPPPATLTPPSGPSSVVPLASPPSSTPAASPPPALLPPPSNASVPPPSTSYPNCPFTGAPPKTPAVPPSRCLAAKQASCCTDCTDLSFALSATSSSAADVLCQILPQPLCSLVSLSNSNSLLCNVFGSFNTCADLLEQMACALTCDPDSGSFVNATTDGYTFNVCRSFATTVMGSCINISLPLVPGNLGSLLGDKLLPILFKGLAKTLLQVPGTVTVNIVDGSGGQCYNGPAQVPETPFCCDPLDIPKACPSETMNFNIHPNWASQAGNRQAADVCRGGGSPPNVTASPPPSTVILPPVPPSPATPATNSTMSPPPLAPATASPPQSNTVPPQGNASVAPIGSPTSGPGSGPAAPGAYPVCPLTGQLPVASKVEHKRCPMAKDASCCTDCYDIKSGLQGVSANISSIICSLLPPACNLFQGQNGDIQLCSVFVKFPMCEIILEEMVCAATCNPNAGNYLSASGAGYDLSICSSYAQKAYAACKDLQLPGFTGTLGSVLPDAEKFVSILYKGIAKVLVGADFTTTVSNGTSGCFAGASALPPEPVCCDPLSVPSTCPPGAVNFTANPSWNTYSNRPINQQVCQQQSQEIAAASGSAEAGVVSPPADGTGGASTAPPPPTKAAPASRPKSLSALFTLGLIVLSFVMV